MCGQGAHPRQGGGLGRPGKCGAFGANVNLVDGRAAAHLERAAGHGGRGGSSWRDAWCRRRQCRRRRSRFGTWLCSRAAVLAGRSTWLRDRWSVHPGLLTRLGCQWAVHARLRVRSHSSAAVHARVRVRSRSTGAVHAGLRVRSHSSAAVHARVRAEAHSTGAVHVGVFWVRSCGYGAGLPSSVLRGGRRGLRAAGGDASSGEEALTVR